MLLNIMALPNFIFYFFLKNDNIQQANSVEINMRYNNMEIE